MSPRPVISFAKTGTPKKGNVIVLSAEDGGLSAAAKACDPSGVLPRAFAVAEFSGDRCRGSSTTVRLDVIARSAASIRHPNDWRAGSNLVHSMTHD